MTRKNLFSLLVAVIIVLMSILPTASAFVEEVDLGNSDDVQQINVYWDYPIPPSQKGDQLNIAVGLVFNGITYVPYDVFNLLAIPKCPTCEGTLITLDGVSNVYYPLREDAEKFGYSVLWGIQSEKDGKVLKRIINIAKKNPEKLPQVWIQIKRPVAEDNFTFYDYHYAYVDDTKYWWFVAEDKIDSVPKEWATVNE